MLVCGTRIPCIEGILYTPSRGGATVSPTIDALKRAVAAACRSTLHPWCDGWLHVAGLPVDLTTDHLLPAAAVLPSADAGDVLVATVHDEFALAMLCHALRAYAPCASLPVPLPLLDELRYR